ncbi:MAG: hypothetical protein FJ308_14245 [Planctomycetes bacterium]|nr:hypothetical protein [Planctomycetota bacterium]
MPPVVQAVAHRWRYAYPHWLRDRLITGQPTPSMRLASTVASRCLWDPSNRMGACGDWLVNDGIAGGIEGAMSSGVALAGQVLRWLTQHGTGSRTGGVDRKGTGGYKQMELFE